MSKTLYISDLDGTLLGKNAEVSGYTAKTLNKLIACGMHFSIATARTAVSSAKITSNVDINIPVVLMNGVIVYNMRQQKNMKIELLDTKTVIAILAVLKRHEITGFMYCINDNLPIIYYETLDLSPLRRFHDERVQRYHQTFVQVGCFDEAVENDVVYFTLRDKKERLMPIYNELKTLDTLEVVLYMDNYDNDLWFLECFSDKASKYNAVQYLREKYKYEKIIGFGDNLNDLPLFKACDICFAVGNAKDEVKAAATGIIGSNDEDGVAKWLAENVR